MKNYYTTPAANCATLVEDGGTAIADPCYLVPDSEWSGFLDAYYKARGPSEPYYLKPTADRRVSMVWKDVELKLTDTDGDGIFFGVAVDSGMLASFDFEAAKSAFGLSLTRCDEAEEESISY